METKKHLTEQERYTYLKRIPKPDRYILLGSSCKKTDEQIKAHFNEVKSRTQTLPVEDIPQEKLYKFAKRYTEQKIADILNDPKIGLDGKCTMCLGIPGAGKSTLIKDITQTTMSFHADADKIKVALSEEFGVDVNGPSMHEYSGQIMNNFLIPALLENKVNFVQEKIGDEIDKMVNYANNYKDMGYNVSLVLIHCDNDVCRERNIARCEKFLSNGENPRIVSDSDIVRIGNTPTDTYMYLMEEHSKLFESGKAYCSDVPFGAYPIHLQSMDYIQGKRVENNQTREYIHQGEQFKSKSIRCQGKKYLLTTAVDKNLAEEIKRGVEEIATTGDLKIENYSKESVDALGEINDASIYALADILNPTQNYISSETTYDTEKISNAIQNYTEQRRKRSPNIEGVRFL